jgi:hypothetical protein
MVDLNKELYMGVGVGKNRAGERRRNEAMK